MLVLEVFCAFAILGLDSYKLKLNMILECWVKEVLLGAVIGFLYVIVILMGLRTSMVLTYILHDSLGGNMLHMMKIKWFKRI